MSENIAGSLSKNGPPQPVSETERALERTAAQLRSIIETVPDALIVIDDRGLIDSFSPAAERLFGYVAAEVIGKNVGMLMPSPYRERHDAYLERYLTTGERRIIGIGRVVVGLRADGTTFPMELSVGEARMEDRRLFTGFVHDITERQSARERLQDLQSELMMTSRISAMGQMASALAHELNQPLTAVINYVQATRRMLQTGGATPERLSDIMDKAVAQASRAGQIIHRMRQFMQKGDTERHVENFSKLMEEAVALSLVGAKESSIQVRTETAANLPEVLVDRIQIQQVVLNLIRNSMEALAESATKELFIGTTLDENNFIEVIISDSGPGLSEEVVRQLFQPFVTTKEKGMGLGLSICRSIIDAHGGRMWATANQPHGVAFHFTIPPHDGRA